MKIEDIKVEKIDSIIAENPDGTLEFSMDNSHDTTLSQESEYVYRNGKTINETLWQTLYFARQKEKAAMADMIRAREDGDSKLVYTNRVFYAAYLDIRLYIESLLDEE